MHHYRIRSIGISSNGYLSEYIKENFGFTSRFRNKHITFDFQKPSKLSNTHRPLLVLNETDL